MQTHLSHVPLFKMQASINGNLRTQGNPDLLERELLLLPPGRVPKELLKPQTPKGKKIGKKITKETDPLKEKALEELTLLQKVSVLMRSIGFKKTSQIIEAAQEPSQPPRSMEDLEKEMSQFEDEVAEWTSGIVTCPQLDSFRALRMLLFAALENCWKLEDPSARTGIGTDKIYTGKEALEQQRSALLSTFRLAKELTGSSEQMSNLQTCLAASQGFFAQYAQVVAQPTHANHVIQKQQLESIAQIEKILELFQKALKDPIHLLPILLFPIQTQPLNGTTVTSLVHHLDPKIEEWLSAFERSFRFQSSPFLDVLKTHLENKKLYKRHVAEYQEAQRAYEDLANRSQAILNNLTGLLKEWQAYQNQTPAKQREQTAKLERMAVAFRKQEEQLKKLNESHTSCRAAMQTVIDLCHGTFRIENAAGTMESDLPRWLAEEYEASIHYPFHHMMVLCTFVALSIHNSCSLYQETFSKLEVILSPRFRTLRHVTVVDLLSWQTLQDNLDLLDAISQGKIPETEDLVQNLLVFQEHMDAVFIEMRRYYLLRRHTRGRDLDDIFLDAQCSNKLVESNETAKQMLQQKPHPQVRAVLEHYTRVTNLLSGILSFERWPELFVQSPFAVEKENPKMEEQFYSAQLSVLRRVFLKCEPGDLRLGLLGLIGGKPFYEEEGVHIKNVSVATQEIATAMQRAQNELRNRQKKKEENFVAEARHFWSTCMKCQKEIENALEKAQFPLEQYLHENPQHSEALKEVQKKWLQRLEQLLQGLVFNPGHSLLSYFQTRELIEEEENGKKLRSVALEERRAVREQQRPASFKPKAPEVQPSAKPPAPQAVQKPPIPKQAAVAPVVVPAVAPFDRFRQLCHIFGERCRFFSAAHPATQDTILNNQRQHEYASNLLRNLQTLEELVRISEDEEKRPVVRLETMERLSLVLEQSAKLACAILNLSETVEDKPNPILRMRGKECYWHSHAPILLVSPVDRHSLNNKKILLFTREERAQLQALERVVAVTYRNPFSGRDVLSQALTKGEIHEGRRVLKEGIRICLKLLDYVAPVNTLEQEEAPWDAEQLEKALTPCVSIVGNENGWLASTDECLYTLEQRLARIHRFRMIELNRNVQAVARRDASQPLRVGTIDEALQDIGLNLSLCEDLLMGPEAPTLALTMAEAALSRQGALLAEVMLVLLSHLPCPDKPGSRQHCLWVESKGRPLRYAHDIVAYARILCTALPAAGIRVDEAFFARMQQAAERLAPYLQQRHRYVVPPCELGLLRDKIADLSKLRRRVFENPGTEAAKLGPNPQERVDSHLRQVLLNEVKAPLVQTLRMVDTLLAIYEELLYRR